MVMGSGRGQVMGWGKNVYVCKMQAKSGGKEEKSKSSLGVGLGEGSEDVRLMCVGLVGILVMVWHAATGSVCIIHRNWWKEARVRGGEESPCKVIREP